MARIQRQKEEVVGLLWTSMTLLQSLIGGFAMEALDSSKLYYKQ